MIWKKWSWNLNWYPRQLTVFPWNPFSWPWIRTYILSLNLKKQKRINVRNPIKFSLINQKWGFWYHALPSVANRQNYVVKTLNSGNENISIRWFWYHMLQSMRPVPSSSTKDTLVTLWALFNIYHPNQLNLYSTKTKVLDIFFSRKISKYDDFEW